MPIAAKYPLCALLGYLIGNINPAYLIARLKGFDIRDRGSGNAGASNAIITMGKFIGVLAMIFDVAKAYVAVWLSEYLFSPSLLYAAEISGVCVVIGHIFPFTMGFRGGKGLACLGGAILAFDIRVFGIMLVLALLLAIITDYLCVVPITGSIAFPIIYYFMTGSLIGALIYAALIPIILYKHAENLKRIRQGKEVHFSFLWNKNKEIDRVSDKWESDTYSRDDLP